MWVTLVHGGAIARVAPDGDLRVHPVADGSRPSLITRGSDGALWFTRSGDDRIGRITTDGEQSSVELTSGSGPFGIAAGPDGALWFTTMTAATAGRLGDDGTVDEGPVGGRPSVVPTGTDRALSVTMNRDHT